MVSLKQLQSDIIYLSSFKNKRSTRFGNDNNKSLFESINNIINNNGRDSLVVFLWGEDDELIQKTITYNPINNNITVDDSEYGPQTWEINKDNGGIQGVVDNIMGVYDEFKLILNKIHVKPVEKPVEKPVKQQDFSEAQIKKAFDRVGRISSHIAPTNIKPALNNIKNTIDELIQEDPYKSFDILNNLTAFSQTEHNLNEWVNEFNTVDQWVSEFNVPQRTQRPQSRTLNKLKRSLIDFVKTTGNINELTKVLVKSTLSARDASRVAQSQYIQNERELQQSARIRRDFERMNNLSNQRILQNAQQQFYDNSYRGPLTDRFIRTTR